MCKRINTTDFLTHCLEKETTLMYMWILVAAIEHGGSGKHIGVEMSLASDSSRNGLATALFFYMRKGRQKK